ncbi:hypothetical protein C8J56DRAFT_101661 [Mycena floridula]|nr:hypothetical protein C8J56DRAFT_101661 [Mycena floridula]
MRNSDKLSRCLLLELTFRCRPVAFQRGLILQHRRLLEPSPSSSEAMSSSLRSSCLSFMFVCPFFFVPGIPMANLRSKIRHHIKDPCQIPRSEYSGVVLLCHSVAARRPGHSAPPSSAAGQSLGCTRHILSPWTPGSSALVVSHLISKPNTV